MTDERLQFLLNEYRFSLNLESSNNAITEILERKSLLLYTKSYYILRNVEDAKDCLQNMKLFFLSRAFDNRQKDFAKNVNLKTVENFLLRTITNLSINYKTRYKRKNLTIEITENCQIAENHDSDSGMIIRYESALQKAINNLDVEIKDFTLSWLRKPHKKKEIMKELMITDREYRSRYMKMKFLLKLEIMDIIKYKTE